MKKRIFSILLALCLMVSILPTTALALSATGTVVYNDSETGEGYLYVANFGFAKFGPNFQLPQDLLKVGQTVYCQVSNNSEGAVVTSNEAYTFVDNGDAMALNISGEARLEKGLTITVSRVPEVGTASVQLYRAADTATLFDDASKLGDAYTPSGAKTYTVQNADLGYYIGAKLTYTVTVDETPYTTTLTAQTAKVAPIGGSCGENLTWTLTGSGDSYALTISGTGAMTDYNFGDNGAPWLALSYVNNITSLTLSEGITHVGSWAFGDGGAALALQSTAFPSTLESIGDYAFYYCYREGDISLTLPNGLTTLGKGVFQNCSGLSEIILPDSLMTVGENLFTGTSSNPLTVYCLAGTAEELPSWAKAEYLDSTHPERITIHGLTHHETPEATCVTPGTEEYYSFDEEGVSETMAKRYYNAERTAYTTAPVTIPATGQHTVDENGECTVCHQTFAASVTKDGTTSYFIDVPSAVASPDANGGTITLLKNADALDFTGKTLTCTVDLNGKTVTTLTGGDNAVLTVTDAVGGGKVTNLVANGTITLSAGTYDLITDNGGTLSLSADHLCRWEGSGSVKWEDISTAVAAEREFTVLPIPVIITAQPTGGDVVPPATGRELTVTVESHSSQPVTYEWWQHLGEVKTPIADSNSASYTATEAAKYYCIATCDSYSAVSDIATVTVTPALASVTVDDATTYYVSLPAALIAANEVPGSETVTVRALDNSTGTLWHDVILNRTAPIVLDLGGFTVTANSGSDAVNLSVNGADLTVKKGTLEGYAYGDSTVQVNSGTLELESDLTLTNERKQQKTLEVLGGTVTVNGAEISGSFSVDQSGKNSTLVINSGTFSNYVHLGSGTTTLNGGDYTGTILVTSGTVADILGEGCAYRYTDGESSGLLADPATLGKTIGPVTVEKPVVRIGNTPYGSLDKAALAVKSGETITLMQDAEAGSWTVSVDSVTLDLNGHTLDFGSNNIEVGEGATLTVIDSSEGKTGRLIGSTTAPLINVAGTLLLESGSFENKDADGVTIADEAGSRAVSAFLADGCCYYACENTDLNTGAVLTTGTDTSVSGSICVGKAAVASVTVGGTITRYADLFDALTAANGQTATVTLLQDTIVPETAVQADKSLHLTEGTITLDLGGHTATLLLRGIWLEGNVNLTVQNGKLDGGPENDYIVSVRAGSTFTLAASGTLKAVGGNTHALNVYSNIESAASAIATLHGTVIGDDGISGLVVVESEGAKLTVDGGSVQSLSFDSKATVELSGGSFGSIEAENVNVLKVALKTGYAYKEAGEEGKWVMPASGNLTDVIVVPAPVQITEQPQSVTIAYGESTTLSVTTVGTDIKYMWNVQSSSGMNYFPGNDDGTFTFPEDAAGLTAVPDDYDICAICKVMPEGSVAPLWTTNSNIVTVTVTPAKLTDVAVSQSGTLTYTGKAQTAAVSAAATSVNDQTVSFTYCAEENGEYTNAVPAFTDAGSHTVYYKASAANHETVTGSFTVTIAPAKLTGVSAEQSGALTYTGEAQTAAVTTAATAVNSQTVTFTYSAEQDGEYTGAVPAFTNAGSYTVYYKAAAASHETVTGSFTVTIAKRDLSITAKDQNITYGDLISQEVAQVDAVGLASGQTLSSITLTANALTVAEGATITPSEAVISGGADNYNITYNAGTLTVTPAELKAVSVTQRGTLTYNKQAQTAVVTAAATAANAQTVSFTYCATESGEYTSAVPAFTGAGGHTVYYKAAAANHETATGYFTVTIAKAPVTAFDLTDLIAAPVWNAERATALSDQSQLTGEFSWTAEGGKWEATIKFVKGEVYTADVAIRATANYTFEGISEESVFTHDSATSITQSEIADDACTLTIVFKAVPGDNLLPEENLPEEVNNAGSFYVDGVPHNTSEFENGHIDLGAADRSNLTTYTYSGGENSYPTGMSVFSVESTEDGYTVTPKPEFSNLLQYKGCSIRTSGVKGIRMITAIPDELRAKLLKAELDGYKLMEYGTVVAFSANMAGGKLTLEDSYAKHNYAYKRGVSDAVFGRAEGLTQFTNVLVDFTPEQCKQELAMRPYIILEDANGNSQAIYGGIVYRSIGYIAWQNRDTYEAGTAEYRYIHDIIDYVYGDNTPA